MSKDRSKARERRENLYLIWARDDEISTVAYCTLEFSLLSDA
jgi:hypothetical protein